MIKVSIIQAGITIKNIYAPNKKSSKIHKAKTEVKEEKNKSILTVKRLHYPTFNNRKINQAEDK